MKCPNCHHDISVHTNGGWTGWTCIANGSCACAMTKDQIKKHYEKDQKADNEQRLEGMTWD